MKTCWQRCQDVLYVCEYASYSGSCGRTASWAIFGTIKPILLCVYTYPPHELYLKGKTGKNAYDLYGVHFWNAALLPMFDNKKAALMLNQL